MTEEEKKVFMKIKDRHEYFTRDDRFEETNDFEKECLFEIGYLTQIIEKLQKENLLLSAKENMSAYFEFKRNYISKDKIREKREDYQNEIECEKSYLEQGIICEEEYKDRVKVYNSYIFILNKLLEEQE